jgi:sugar phosphate isomerase/epimerase
MAMRLGVCLDLYQGVPFEEILDDVARYGYEAVEFCVDRTAGLFDAADIIKPGVAARIKHATRQRGLAVTAIRNSAEGQLVLGPHHRDTDRFFEGTPEEKIAHGIERMILSAQAAGALEVPVVCGFCGCEDYSRWFPWPDPEGWERMAPAFVERWGAILDAFAKEGVVFAQECHPKQYAYNTETALDTVRLLGGRKEWGFNLDPANLMLSGVDPVVFAQALACRVYNVHAKDGEVVAHNVARSGLLAHGDWRRPDRGFRFRVPGWGDVAWRSLITELALAGYDGAIAFEHEDPTMGKQDGLEKAIAYLRPLIIHERFPGRWW